MMRLWCGFPAGCWPIFLRQNCWLRLREPSPEINDELAKQFGAPSLDELRKNVQKRLEIDKKRWVEEDLRAQVYQKLVNMAGFELPKDLVEEQTGERLYRYKMEMLQRGIPMEE